MKKAISILLTAMLLVSNIIWVSATETATFDDVPNDHWAYDAIQYFYDEDVIHGYDENTFAPDDYLTREQYAKLLSIIYNKTDFIATEQTFTDVPPDLWSYNYIESVKEYLTGYYPQGGEPFFNPEGKATREDIAYSLVKISGMYTKTADESVLDSFQDSKDISVNLKSYMSIAVKEELVVGYDGYLRPQDGITRAEAATLLFRAIKRPVTEDDKPSGNTGSSSSPGSSGSSGTSRPSGNGSVSGPSTKPSDDKEPDKEEAKPHIYSESITEFGAFYPNGDSFYRRYVDDPEALEGKIELTFGEDVMKDTKLYAKVTVEGQDVYEIKSTSIDNYTYTGNDIELVVTYNVYHNGDLVMEEDGTRATISKDKDEFFIYGLTSVIGNQVVYTINTFPDIPENQSGKLWWDASIACFDVTNINNIDATGHIYLDYNVDKQIARIRSEITADGKYTVEVSETESVDHNYFVGKITIKKDGEVVAEDVRVTIPLSNNLKIDTNIAVITDDSNWMFKLRVVEFSVPTVDPDILWKDVPRVGFNVTKINKKPTTGHLYIDYNTEYQEAKIDSLITVNEQEKYSIEVVDTLSVNHDYFSGDVTIRQNGRVVGKHVPFSIPLNNKLELDKTITIVSDDSMWMLELVVIEISNIPSEPEDQPDNKPDDQPENIWSDTLPVGFELSKLNDMDATGDFYLDYNIDKQTARIVAEITADGKYTVEVSDTTSVSYDEFIGKITIKKDGEVVSENIPVTIPLKNKVTLEEYITVSTDDNNWKFEMQVIEIGIPTIDPDILWKDVPHVGFEVRKINDEEVAGTLYIDYNAEYQEAKTQSDIRAEGDAWYSIDVIDTLSVSPDEFSGKIKIWRSGRGVGKNVLITIPLNNKLEETITVTSNDGNWTFELYVIEISK